MENILYWTLLVKIWILFMRINNFHVAKMGKNDVENNSFRYLG